MSCPDLDPEIFKENLNKLSDVAGMNLIDELNKMATEECPISGGGKMRGGDIVTRRNIKLILWIIVGILTTLAAGSTSARQLVEGFQMLFSGECTSWRESAFSVLAPSWQNPVCRGYYTLYNAVLETIAGDSEARAQLIGYVVQGIGAPYALSAGIDSIAGQIESGVRTMMTGNRQTQKTGGKSRRGRKNRRNRSRRYRK